MTKVCLVACARTKRDRKAVAENLYASPLFEKSREYAISRFDGWYILSAKYGLLRPDRQVAPYDETLKSMPKRARMEWADCVHGAIVSEIERGAVLAFVAGQDYRAGLAPRLTEDGYTIRVPLEHLSIGRQLSWLKKLHDEATRLRHLDEFYTLLKRLEHGIGNRRVLSKCSGGMGWPDMGVYFFFEANEYRASNVAEDRVVRVGTHTVSKGAKSTLWNRLRTHRGGENGSGNHRGSIFRLHVGAALINQSNGKLRSATWGHGQVSSAEVKASEAIIEAKVSECIGAMSLLWLAIEDEAGPASDRAYIEQNAIALLSGRNGPIDFPTSDWLGRFSTRESIRKSGLWNINYADDDYDPRFLETMAAYVDVTLGKSSPPKHSIAPRGWAAQKRRGLRQFSLFQDK